MTTIEERASIRPSLPLPNPSISYWQDPPDPEVSDLRSTSDLPQSADYVIVGSGLSGAVIAQSILERLTPGSASVLMLEARQAVSGATGRNGGHTKAAPYKTYSSRVQTYGQEEAVKMARMEHANILATHEFARVHNLNCESRQCNTVDFIYDQESFDTSVKAIERMREDLGDDPVAQHKIYYPEDAKREFLCDGYYNGEQIRGAIEYMGGSCSAYKLVIGMLKLSLAKGLQLHTHTPVTAVQPVRDESESGQEWLVKTPRGNVKTRTLILATNGYTAHLLPELQSQIVPVRGQVTAQRQGTRLKQIVPEGLRTTMSIAYKGGFEYVIQRPLNHPDVPEGFGGDIIIGGGLARLPQEGLTEFGETDDTSLNPLNSGYLANSLVEFFGKHWGDDDEHGRIRSEWTGIMGFTPNSLPFVGALPGREGMWISAGFNGAGMVLALKSAQALVQMIFHEEEQLNEWFPAAFRVTSARIKQEAFRGRL